MANTLVLGAKFGGTTPGPDQSDMAAHAWLRVGEIMHLGGEARDGFVPVVSYHGDPSRLD